MGRKDLAPRPLRVLWHWPNGKVRQALSVGVVFDAPMALLGPGLRAQEAKTARFVSLDPPVPWRVRWASRGVLKLVFSRSLPPATRYQVTVRRGLRSLDGRILAQDLRWSFETSPPELLAVRTEGPLAGRAGLLLVFDRTGALPAVQRSLQVTLDGKPWPMVWQRAQGARDLLPDEELVIGRPRRAWPLGGHEVVLKVAKDRPAGLQGWLLRRKLSFRTAGPLTFQVLCNRKDVRQRACFPVTPDFRDGLVLSWSEPVDREQVLVHVRISPTLGPLRRILRPVWDECPGPKVCSRKWMVARLLAPRRRYTVRLLGQVRDIYGERLTRKDSVRFATQSYPVALFPSRSRFGYLRPGPRLPIRWLNGKLIAEDWLAEGPRAVWKMLSCLGDPWNAPWRSEEELISCLNALPHTHQDFSAKALDRVSTARLALRPGWHLLRFQVEALPRLAGKYPRGSHALRAWRSFQAVRLGLHARASPENLLVWVTDLATGRPIPGAQVVVLGEEGQELAHGLTDARGVLVLRGGRLGKALRDSYNPNLLVSAQKGGSWTHLPLGSWKGWWEEFPPFELEQFGGPRQPVWVSAERQEAPEAWQEEPVDLRGWLGTDRKLYRPGELVRVAGAVRAFEGWRRVALPVRKARLVLEDPTEKPVLELPVALGPMGAFEASLRLPQRARLGRWSLALDCDRMRLFTRHIQLSQARPPRFRLQLQAPRLLGPLERISLQMRAESFSGTLPRNMPVDIWADGGLVAFEHEHQGHRLVVGCLGYLPERRRVWAQQTETMVDGRLSLELPAAPLNRWAGCPVEHHVGVRVQSAGGQVVSRRMRVLQLPGRRVVGVSELSPDGRGRQAYEVFLLNERLRPVAGRVRVRLFSREWGSVGRRPRLYGEEVLHVGRRGLRFALPRGKWDSSRRGRAYALVFEAKDPEGRTARTVLRARFWGWSRTQAHRPKPWLRIRLPRRPPKPGETVSVRVERSPGVADGLLVAEREGILQVWPLHFRGRRAISVPVRIRDSLGPSVRLTALAPVPRLAYRPSPHGLVVASRTLRLDEGAWRLSVAIQPEHRVYAPRELVRVMVQVRDAQGQPVQAAVVLTAVDAAALEAGGPGREDPVERLLNAPAVQVAWADLRAWPADLGWELVLLDPWPKTGGGAGGYGGAPGLRRLGPLRREEVRRRRFEASPWQTLVVTDAQGRAQASFRLPDSLTNFRILAFAVDAGRRSGLGEASLAVRLPVHGEPNLPKFLRVGDTAWLGVTLHNGTGTPQEIRATLRVGPGLALAGQAETALQVAGRSAETVRFAVQALRPGRTQVAFRVCSLVSCDVIEKTIPIRLPATQESFSVAGLLHRRVRHRLAGLEKLRRDTGGLAVRLGTSLALGLGPGARKLLEVPLSGTEPLVSRLLAAAALDRLLGEEGMRSQIRRLLARLAARQNSDGGFPFWPGGRSEPWVTGQVLVALERLARSQLALGMDSVRKAAARFLERSLERARTYRHPPFWFPSAVYALALHGRHTPVRKALAWLGRHLNELSFGDKALALAALARLPGRDRKGLSWLERRLFRVVLGRLRLSGNLAHTPISQLWWFADSPVRDTALALLALVEQGLLKPWAPRLGRWLVVGRKRAGFRTTQEAFWAILALWALTEELGQTGHPAVAEARLGSKLLARLNGSRRRAGEAHGFLSMAQLQDLVRRGADSVRLASRGPVPVFYTLRLQGVPRALTTSPEDRGFRLRREIVRLTSAGERAGGPLRCGDWALVTLEVETTQGHHFVEVEDPLPAGLQAVDFSLGTEVLPKALAQALAQADWADYVELGSERVLFSRQVLPPGRYRFSYVARAVTPGRFIWPPARVFELYGPEVFGRTGVRILDVPSP